MDTQDVDCAGPGVNRCVDGQCTCGATGGSCTAASGQPRCVQAANLLMLAVGADAENAVCTVSYFFLAMIISCLINLVHECKHLLDLSNLFSALRAHVYQVRELKMVLVL